MLSLCFVDKLYVTDSDAMFFSLQLCMVNSDLDACQIISLTH